eukprot:TRINITY_DN3035_c0_g2_i3.p1 TRINITY_DN3035_c0_g2~~TRINITY_DN3035_c0_g2_i3.p1  ORF type:complete len:261 (+),score=36.26 TRINITY_DN3035_c0_g2_i3:62-844(+)
MTEIAELQTAIADQILQNGKEEAAMVKQRARRRSTDDTAPIEGKSFTIWLILVALLVLVVGGLGWKKIKTWRWVGSMVFVHLNLILGRHQVGMSWVGLRQIGLGFAVLCGVFSYPNAVLSGIGLMGVVLSAFPISSHVNGSDVAAAAAVLLASGFSRVSWTFYRDLYTVFSAHSNHNVPWCYAAVSLILFFQLFSTVTLAYFLATVLSHQLTYPSLSLTHATDKLSGHLPSALFTAVVCFLVVASSALHHNFPGNNSWFW